MAAFTPFFLVLPTLGTVGCRVLRTFRQPRGEGVWCGTDVYNHLLQLRLSPQNQIQRLAPACPSILENGIVSYLDEKPGTSFLTILTPSLPTHRRNLRFFLLLSHVLGLFFLSPWQLPWFRPQVLLRPPNWPPPPSDSLLQPSRHTVSRAVIKNTYLGVTFTCVKPHRLLGTPGTPRSCADLKGSSEQGPSCVSELSSQGAFHCALRAGVSGTTRFFTCQRHQTRCFLCLQSLSLPSSPDQRRHSLPAQLEDPFPRLCCPGLLPPPRPNGVPLPWVPLYYPSVL